MSKSLIMAAIKNVLFATCLISCVAAHSIDIHRPVVRQNEDDILLKNTKPFEKNTGSSRSLPTVAYFAVDLSNTLGSNALTYIQTATSVLVHILPSGKQFAVSSFSGEDSGFGSYLVETFPPSYIGLSWSDILEAINRLSISSDASRNVGAAIRDAVAKLESQKDVGGSVLYLISASGTIGSELELDLVESLIKNNIHLVAAEIGHVDALERFSSLVNGAYFNLPSITNPEDFHDINLAVSILLEEPTVTARHILLSDSATITNDAIWRGTFQMSSDLKDTIAAMHSPTEGSFIATITSPTGSNYELNNNNGSTNWNDPSSTVGLATIHLDAVAGDWEVMVEYANANCISCPDSATIKFQVTASTSDENSNVTSTTSTTQTTTSTTMSTTMSPTMSTTMSTTTEPPTTQATTSFSSTIHSSTILMACGFSVYLWISRHFTTLQF